MAGGEDNSDARPALANIARERQAIEGALRDTDGSREKAAEVLGISATTLWRKMTRLGIVYDARGFGQPKVSARIWIG